MNGCNLLACCNNDPTVPPLNTQTKKYLPSVKAGIIGSKFVPKIPALASIMHQNAFFSQVIHIPIPLIKSAYSFYNRATDSDKAAAVRILELLTFFSYILITACSQTIFQDRRERVRYIGKYSQVSKYKHVHAICVWAREKPHSNSEEFRLHHMKDLTDNPESKCKVSKHF